jgi:hypothetical protein
MSPLVSVALLAILTAALTKTVLKAGRRNKPQNVAERRQQRANLRRAFIGMLGVGGAMYAASLVIALVRGLTLTPLALIVEAALVCFGIGLVGGTLSFIQYLRERGVDLR